MCELISTYVALFVATESLVILTPVISCVFLRIELSDPNARKIVSTAFADNSRLIFLLLSRERFLVKMYFFENRRESMESVRWARRSNPDCSLLSVDEVPPDPPGGQYPKYAVPPVVQEVIRQL